MSVPARFFDGIAPIPHAVGLTLAGPVLSIRGQNGDELERWLVGDLFVPDQDDRTGEVVVTSRARPDARLVLSDPQAIALLQPHMPKLARIVTPRSSGVATWSLLGALAAVVVAALALFGWRGPELLAPLIPQSWEIGIGDAILEAMTEDYDECAADEGRAALDGLLERLVAASGHDGDIRLMVVDSPQVNAFALPGGRMVLFDGLIREAASADEVAGVLAHELGHVVHRHPMRGLLRHLGISFLRRMALGGYGDAIDTAASLGETMLALRNGRDAEREADRAAIAYLERAGLRADGLYAFFSRLAEEGDAAAALGILSTHPPLAERQQATQRRDEGLPALSSDRWRALRQICEIPDGELREAD